MKSENIAAIATSLMPSGVAVIRISGDDPKKIAERMFVPSGNTRVDDFEPYKMYPGEIVCDGFSDFGLCVFFAAPKSFTGENVIEFHSHGGIAITQGVLKRALSLGARLATRGEFTKRAFMNGKLSLSSAEGLIDMINSESISGVKAGYYLYREKLTKQVKYLQNQLKDALSEIDVDMDFPEEDLEISSHENVEKILDKVRGEIKKLLSTFGEGRKIKNGVNVGIVGKPNTGKSSLLNALLNYDKAIVSDTAGTTRDVVEGTTDINGVRFNFSDTAGIRNSGDEIEMLGVKMSEKVLNGSDLLLFVADASDYDENDEKIYEQVKDKNVVFVVNKTDKSDYKDGRADVYVSALQKQNIDGLRAELFSRAVGDVDVNGDFLCEERHYEALKNARQSLDSAIGNLNAVTLDVLAIDLKNAWDFLGEISGETATEEIINNIFSKFCVGK